jgi:hypothetical protein
MKQSVAVYMYKKRYISCATQKHLEINKDEIIVRKVRKYQSGNYQDP